MRTLVELYKRNNHNTDKGGEGGHTYLPLYDSLFSRYQNRACRILEIGIYQGDSLNLFAEYFSKATIYGIDLNIGQIDKLLHSNVRAFGMDAYCAETLNLLSGIGKFDIIIDDGGHTPLQQQYFMEHYSNLLSDNGVLVMEEAGLEVLDNPHIEALRLINYLPQDLRNIAYVEDRRNISNNQYDILIICDKNSI